MTSVIAGSINAPQAHKSNPYRSAPKVRYVQSVLGSDIPSNIGHEGSLSFPKNFFVNKGSSVDPELDIRERSSTLDFAI